ncbi:MAG: hypothetical protein U0103_17140 [Candidatus Obscuribacterales bacterium]
MNELLNGLSGVVLHRCHLLSLVQVRDEAALRGGLGSSERKSKRRDWLWQARPTITTPPSFADGVYHNATNRRV